MKKAEKEEENEKKKDQMEEEEENEGYHEKYGHDDEDEGDGEDEEDQRGEDEKRENERERESGDDGQVPDLSDVRGLLGSLVLPFCVTLSPSVACLQETHLAPHFPSFLRSLFSLPLLLLHPSRHYLPPLRRQNISLLLLLLLCLSPLLSLLLPLRLPTCRTSTMSFCRESRSWSKRKTSRKKRERKWREK